MFEMFQYEFFRNAFLAGILVSVACGIVGTLVVSKRIVSIAGGISHASFGGIGLGYLLNINPLLGALFFGVAASLGIGIISKKTKLKEDTAIGIIWAAGMSLGVIFISMSEGYAPDLFTYLFGNILAVTRGDLAVIAVLDLIVAAVMYLFYKEIVAISFDEEFVRVKGLPVFWLSMLTLVLVSITVVVLIKIVGIILVIALLVIPAATSSNFASTFKSIMALSVLLSMLFISLGLFASYYLNLPSGASIILISVLIFLSTMAFKKG